MKHLKTLEDYIYVGNMDEYKKTLKKFTFKINDIVKYRSGETINSADGFFKVTIIDPDDPNKTYQISNINNVGYYWVNENEITLVEDYELVGRNYNL